SLASVLRAGPLPPDEARRVAGEAATGLAAAGQRGLHHLRLTPQDVLIAHDGAVRVSGVAVAVAIDGPDEQEADAATASRRDANSLVAILYAGLTGRWPLDEKVAGIEPAPRISEGVVPPSQIAAGVPEDLDELCRTALGQVGGGQGPLTPGDFVNLISPWPRDRVQRAGVEPTVVLHLPSAGEATNGVGANADPAFAQETEPTVALSINDLASHGLATSGPPTEHLENQDFQQNDVENRSLENHNPTTADKAAAVGAAAAEGSGNTLADAGSAGGVAGGKRGSFVSGTEGTPAGPAPGLEKHGNENHGLEDRAVENHAAEDQHAEHPFTQRMRLPAGIPSRRSEHDGSSSPLRSGSPGRPPSRGQTALVVVVVAAFVGVALFVGYRGLRGVTSGISDATSQGKPAITRSAPPTGPPGVAGRGPQAGADGAIAILSATGYDPEGDKTEGDSKAARVYDGDLSTSWTSSRYATAEFGNLKKGLGVLLDLGQTTSIHHVTIELGQGPVDVKVYAATDPSIQDAAVIGKSTDASGHLELKAPATLPQAQYVIVWFTKLAPDNGKFRASISEIALS
ncbi:MAG: eukaryotic-like serine/threonine-protein kinase, partial [Actinomycetota bacterium]|nr:eukaryotic-like serine/threonine-protein kinase [Actinomycetota bacterium]